MSVGSKEYFIHMQNTSALLIIYVMIIKPKGMTNA